MKIFVNARFLTQPLSGVQRYAIECSRQIKKLLSDVVFIAPANIIHLDIAAELDVKVIGKHTGHVWEQYDLPQYLSHYNNAPLLSLANTAPLFYKNNYLTIHDLAFLHHPEWNTKLFAAWYNFLIPRLAGKAKHIFTVSDTVKNEILRYYKVLPQNISLTYNGIAQDMLSLGANAHSAKQKIILSVGSFNIRKNHHALIEAFIRSELKNTYRLIIIGDKNKVFSHTTINAAALRDNNIDIIEHCSDADLISMYQKAEILASLSVYEGFGIPLLEGIFFNCKILCSAIPVYEELFSDAAVFCDPLSITSIIDALHRIAAVNTADTNNNIVRKKLLENYTYLRSAQTIAHILQPLQ